MCVRVGMICYHECVQHANSINNLIINIKIIENIINTFETI